MQQDISVRTPGSIMINANPNGMTGGATGCYIDPIRQGAQPGWEYVNAGVMWYDDTHKEIRYEQNKTFVIDHPVDKNKYLVHACLEGPEAGVYYRGKATIENEGKVTIKLPDYVDKIATNFTVQITPIHTPHIVIRNTYTTSEVENNEFTVYGDCGSFFWHVYGERCQIVVEPNKEDYYVKGDGPYTYMSPRDK